MEKLELVFLRLLPVAARHAASGQLPEAQDHGSTFFRVQRPAHHRPKEEEEEDSPLARKYNSPVLWGCSAPRRPWDLLGHISDQQNGHRLGFYVNLAKKMDVW